MVSIAHVMYAGSENVHHAWCHVLHWSRLCCAAWCAYSIDALRFNIKDMTISAVRCEHPPSLFAYQIIKPPFERVHLFNRVENPCGVQLPILPDDGVLDAIALEAEHGNGHAALGQILLRIRQQERMPDRRTRHAVFVRRARCQQASVCFHGFVIVLPSSVTLTKVLVHPFAGTFRCSLELARAIPCAIDGMLGNSRPVARATDGLPCVRDCDWDSQDSLEMVQFLYLMGCGSHVFSLQKGCG